MKKREFSIYEKIYNTSQKMINRIPVESIKSLCVSTVQESKDTNKISTQFFMKNYIPVHGVGLDKIKLYILYN